MFFRSHTPARPLSDFVEWFWYEFSGTTPTEYLRRIAEDCMRKHVVA